LVSKPCVAAFIVRDLRIFAMGSAIDFHRQLRRRAIEIKDVGSDGVLVSKDRHIRPATL